MNATDADALRDWTVGADRFLVHRCAHGHVWASGAGPCPQCAAGAVTSFPSAGRGTVIACTLLHHAPDGDWSPLLPYALLCVRLDEGAQVLGHSPITHRVGSRVKARFAKVTHRPIPIFEQKADAA
ncbi:MAG: OB-fold domain-containing protein [Sphingomonadaceae bacterium]|nr:OB-fold domain-containing protein [Sphingomonadaceae bacterium]